MNHATRIKKSLKNVIMNHVAHREIFVRNPDTDFIRNRKLGMETMIRCVLEMGGNSLPIELNKFFKHSVETPTKSAFVQQRQKLLPETFKSIFDEFNDSCTDKRRFKGYRLFAADGTGLNVVHDPTKNSYIAIEGKKGYNQLHINALYDICNQTYADFIVQPRTQVDERDALTAMLERNEFTEKNIVILDRGYEGYNMFTHLLNTKNMNFIARIKQGCGGLRDVKALPMTELDKYIELCITTTQTNIEDIKKLYHMRWGIETSFRDLKYTIGLVNLHSKNENSVLQEICAYFTIYNFCSRISISVEVEQRISNKHKYQLNFKFAFNQCRCFLSGQLTSKQLIENIQHYTEPIRPGRTDKRKIKPTSFVSFNYRVSA